MVEKGGEESLSMRAVASALGVKAPSLYRYFADKAALEFAVCEEVLRRMRRELDSPVTISDPKVRFVEMAKAFVLFARRNYSLYNYSLYSYAAESRLSQNYSSKEGKATWNTLLNAVGDVSRKPDDTASAVAVWSFLHGYALLENSGAFGASGPKDAFETGLSVFLKQL